MTPPVALLGCWLDDPTITVEAKYRFVSEVLYHMDDHPFHAVGKAACWLGYRYLDRELHQNSLQSLLEGAVERIKRETTPQWQDQVARWVNSILMVSAYIDIKHGNLDQAEYKLEQMDSIERIELNPTGAVNACRAMSLLVALNYGSQEGAKWIDECIHLYRTAVVKWNLTNVPFCAGGELVLAAMAVNISVCLAPSVLARFQGSIMPVEDILAIDTSKHYNEALRSLIYR